MDHTFQRFNITDNLFYECSVIYVEFWYILVVILFASIYYFYAPIDCRGKWINGFASLAAFLLCLFLSSTLPYAAPLSLTGFVYF